MAASTRLSNRPVRAGTPPAAPLAAAPSGNGNGTPGAFDLGTVVRHWDQVVTLLNSQSSGRNSAALLKDMRQAWPVEITGDTVLIGVLHDFARGRLEDMPRRAIVEDAFSQVLGRRVRIRCEQRPETTRPDPTAFPSPGAPPLGARASKARAIFDEE